MLPMGTEFSEFGLWLVGVVSHADSRRSMAVHVDSKLAGFLLITVMAN
jgi:hypothetical protein